MITQSTLETTPINRLMPGEVGWPAGVDDLSRAPSSLHTKGAVPRLVDAVAIVGTRSADRAAERFAHSLAADLASHGRVVVSGGATGIDAAAHEGALSVGGSTLAVLPSFLDAPYPRRNNALFGRILERGALLTEAEGPCAPKPSRCLSRNRLIAALSSSVVVVQAPERSGALSTAAHARALGRPVFAVPASPYDPRGGGCLELLRKGAQICIAATDVLSLAALDPPAAPRRAAPRSNKSSEFNDLGEDEQVVMAALTRGPLGAEELCEALPLGAARVQRALLTLLLTGSIDELHGGRFAAVTR